MGDRPDQLDGILCVDKPTGLTSHDIVGRVRKATSQRRVGHAGTLDPLASGVLLVGVGRGTRVTEYLMEGTKVYRGTVRFGASSTTDDAGGVLTPVPFPGTIGIAELRLAAEQLTGSIQQLPPAYSAIKVAGKPLYRLARAGETVSLAARPVQIDRIEVCSWAPPDAVIEVTCSKGTYIRSIARDLGVAFGSAAYLIDLTRLASGGFTRDDASTLDEVDRAARLGYLKRLLYPLDRAVATWHAVVLGGEDVARIARGLSVQLTAATSVDRARAYDAQGRLVALLARGGAAELLPRKVFLSGE